jgi:riboflavin synthase
LFTGLIQDIGAIRQVERCGELIVLTIQTSLPVQDLELGESVAVDGICLTVTSRGSQSFQVEASPETLDRTTLCQVQAGRPLNLERALRFSDRLGGHLVTGHIDGIGTIRERRSATRFSELGIRVPADLGRYIVEKGSVAVDGISLTVNRCGPDWFELAVIPYTIARTTLAAKGVGERVNVECDILGKYVEKFLGGRIAQGTEAPQGVTEDFLRQHGFFS